ncbi:MAG: hypothetical protein LBG44_02090 [Gemmatimonadota bacterium]|jgi:hypothetical protein|nr:hypothetical protein [Gemmatimonadota bacterium]
MSADSIPGYELLTRVSDGSVRTYHAFSRTGAVVMAHFVDEANGEAAQARSLIERLPPAERRKVLEAVDARGGLAVVTKFILDFDSFGAWLAAHAVAAAGTPPPVSAPPASEAPRASEPGEFTRAFRSISPDGASVELSDNVASDAPSESPAPASLSSAPVDSAGVPELFPGAAVDEPGEFTRAFSALSIHPLTDLPLPVPLMASPDAAPSAGSAPSTPISSAPLLPVDPGLETPDGRLPAQEAVPEEPHSQPTVPELNQPAAPPDSFPRWMKPDAPDVTPAPSPAAPAGPGEFTRIFGRVETSSPPAPEAPSIPQWSGSFNNPPYTGPGTSAPPPLSGGTGDDYLSRLGRSPVPQPAAQSPAPVPTSSPPAAADGAAVPPWLSGGFPAGAGVAPPSVPTGPSEYTRVISAMSQAPQAPSPAAPAAPAAPQLPVSSPAGRPVALLVGIALIIVLVIVTIVFFVPSSGNPSSSGAGELQEAPVVPE